MVFSIITSFLNRFEKAKKYFGWFIECCILINSIYMWIRKNEYKSFNDCLFHSRKVASQPWIGERTVEYSWVHKFLSGIKNGIVMDVGSKNGLLTTDMLLANNNKVYVLDINATESIAKGNLILEQGNIVSTRYTNNYFDTILLISTLEHIGISGRYGISKNEENLDFLAVQEIFRILKPNGNCYITIPYGLGKSYPMNRLYNKERCQSLFSQFNTITSQYFIFNSNYKLWLEVPEQTASQNNWDVDPWYAIACFCLEKPFT